MLGADTQTTRPSWVTLNERGDTLYAVREQVPMGGVYEMKALRSVENPELVEPAESLELLQETEGQLRGSKKRGRNESGDCEGHGCSTDSGNGKGDAFRRRGSVSFKS